MNSSIYNIPLFEAGRVYYKHDIIKYTGVFNGLTLVSNYLYCISEHTSTSSLNYTKWGGMVAYGGVTRPNFIWTPNYNNRVTNPVKIKKITLGDGYEIRSADSITPILLEYEMPFEKRSRDEITAITHFLTERAGVESFVFGGRPPFQLNKLFVCESDFVNTEEFENTFSLSCKFREVVN